MAQQYEAAPLRAREFGRRLAVAAEQPHDDRLDRRPMCQNPRGQCQDGTGHEHGADDRYHRAQQNRPAERIGETAERNSVESRVEQLHHGHENGGGRGDDPNEREDRTPGKIAAREPAALGGRQIAAQAQAAYRDQDRGRQRQSGYEIARVVRDVVVGVVRQGIVAHHVDRDVGQRRRTGGSA